MTAETRAAAVHVARDYYHPAVDREDWQQEALLAAWQAERTFNGHGTLPGWVRLCVRARMRDLLRAASAEKRPTFAPLYDEHSARPDGYGSLVAEIRQLPAMQARTLVGFAAGLSYPELMAQEGVGYKAIDGRLCAARRTLRTRLAA